MSGWSCSAHCVCLHKQTVPICFSHLASTVPFPFSGAYKIPTSHFLSEASNFPAAPPGYLQREKRTFLHQCNDKKNTQRNKSHCVQKTGEAATRELRRWDSWCEELLQPPYLKSCNQMTAFGGTELNSCIRQERTSELRQSNDQVRVNGDKRVK